MMPILFLWQGSGTPTPPVVVMDGGRRRRPRAARLRDLDRHQDDIRREQLEVERYLAELEKNQQQVPATARTGDEARVKPPREGEPLSTKTSVATPGAGPVLTDAIKRAASAEAVIARARASSAEALAQAKAEDQRRNLLLLLMLD